MQQDYLQMRVLEMAPQVYATGQLFEADLKLIAKQDVRTIMDNRPDDEANEPPLSTDLAKVAEAFGITFVHFPVDPGPISEETAKAFAKTCDGLERPLLIFSGSAARSMKIWETSEAV